MDRPILYVVQRGLYIEDFMTQLRSTLGRRMVIGHQPIVMGILNVTPDSFSDGGQWVETKSAIDHAERMVADGADWIDVGGESTRPGAEPVDALEELRRVTPVIEALVSRLQVPISIDTYKHVVARRAVEIGASVINDVTGFRDPGMREVAAACEATCVVMHMRGNPRTMARLTDYNDVVAELGDYFKDRMGLLEREGIDPERVVLDPGIGFAKNKQQNLLILRHLDQLRRLGRPILIGASRKRLMGDVLGSDADRLAGTVASAITSYLKGARIFRVHEPRPVKHALLLAKAIEFGENDVVTPASKPSMSDGTI